MVLSRDRLCLLLPMPLEIGGMREYELTSLWSMPKQCWLINRPERERLGRMIRKWKKENPKPTMIQECLVEDIIALHIMTQRLRDRRHFFDGEKTDYEQVAKHQVDIESEDLNRKSREFDKYYRDLMKTKTELYKLALANNISINLNGDALDVTSLFKASDKLDGDGNQG